MKKLTIRRNAFTLLELLVVIMIIAILASVLVRQLNQARENGWSARCKANLRSLFQATMNYSIDNSGRYPNAGPWDFQDGTNGWYEGSHAWVNWLPNSPWPHASSGQCADPTWYGNAARSSITNGVLWEYALSDKGIYCCPKFRYLKQRSAQQYRDVARSYAMSKRFGWDWTDGADTARNSQQFAADATDEASRMMLFADMMTQTDCFGTTYRVCNYYAKDTASADRGNDGILDVAPIAADPHNSQESIGFIHKMSGQYYGHVVFLDGHIEAVGLKQPNGTYTNLSYNAMWGLF